MLEKEDSERIQKTPINRQVGGIHYVKLPIQPIEYITKNKLEWCEGNIVKYITRHSIKGGKEDVKKVIHYAELLLQLKYGGD